MIYLRPPDFTSAPTYTLTIHTNGPGGAQVGQSRSFGTGDQRLVYGYNQMPTIAGGTYYVRIHSSTPGVITQMDPRPDFSDPMPGGCLWVGNGGIMTPIFDRDLGLVIMSDDDGLTTDMFTRFTGGAYFSSVTSVGQTFIARGVNLISAAFWLADGTFPTYVVRVLQGGPGGTQVGTTKRNRPARPTADPEMIVTWSPGECPLVPGQTYYLEVTKDGGGAFNSVQINTGDPFPYGDAYQNGVVAPGVDLAGTIMEEQSIGSATRPTVAITNDAIAIRGTNQLTIQWATDLPSDSQVEYGVETPPYASTLVDTQLVTTHSLTITGLQSHTLYHYRATSSRTGYRPSVSRDFVICTRAAASNLLANPSFEEGSGASPRHTLVGWTKVGPLDIAMADGSWFWSFKPTNGNWLLEGAVNGSASDSYLFQRVSNVVAGADYTFSAFCMTGIRENNAWKYDVWQDQKRLVYMRLGIDPTGGTNASASTVQWTPRFYTHRHYTHLAKTAVAQGTNLTVFIHMKGDGGEWHVYGVDDCALTHEQIPIRLDNPKLATGKFQTIVYGRANRTNSVETSPSATNQTGWTTLTNFLNRTGATPFTQPVGAENLRLFRARGND
jgi:hypothetical protein